MPGSRHSWYTRHSWFQVLLVPGNKDTLTIKQVLHKQERKKERKKILLERKILLEIRDTLRKKEILLERRRYP
jgi:hypothetical protein